MKKSILFITSLFILFAGSLAARAQDELKAFQDAAGDRAILYRGKQATRYLFPYNGHPFWRETAFQSGDICFEGNEYHDVLLNIDASDQLALAQLSNGLFAISLSPALTPSLTMGDRRFVGVGPGEALPEGFYELIGNGPEQVYMQVRKTLTSSTNSANGDSIGYYDENYRYEVLTFFAVNKAFYFKDAAGNFSRIRTRGALLRKFPGRRREIRQALKDLLDTYPRPGFETYCEEFMKVVAP